MKSIIPDWNFMATSVRYATRAGHTLFPTGCRPHKPEQNGGEGEPAEFGKNRTLRFSGHP
ncbi:hypothetical protein HMPREF9551_04213 [Escherichia coli MS 196-1]|nr:hypothetical protein HMPREF9551_04213 [Escherichia coli MS 196-1]